MSKRIQLAKVRHGLEERVAVLWWAASRARRGYEVSLAYHTVQQNFENAFELYE